MNQTFDNSHFHWYNDFGKRVPETEKKHSLFLTEKK